MPFNADENQSNNKTQQDPNQPNINLKGSGGDTSAANTGRIANYSTGASPAQASGSGRFTNLSKYMDANQGAGQRTGEQIQSSFDKNVNDKNSNINTQNSQIADAMNKGKETLNQGNQFNSQLKDIGTGLNSFGSMENRSDFDKAGQQALAFQQNPNFSQFQNIQSGNAIDDKGLQQQQGNAANTGQQLSQFTNKNLNNIQTEQGRFSMLQDMMRNKPNFTSGGTRLDQALFQGDKSNPVEALRNNFVNANRQADLTNQNLNTQGTNVTGLVNDENTLIGNLNNQAKSNQDMFNSKLGSQGNIDFINKARKDNYDEYLNQLKSGNISQTVANDLGLSNLNTYQPGVNTGGVISNSPVMSANDIKGYQPNTQQAFTPKDLRMYNTNLADNAASYLKQGRSAQNMQDITTQGDYDAYKALSGISGLDTGKLNGISNLDRSVSANVDANGNSLLANKINDQDTGFKNNFAGKDYSTYAHARTAANDHGNFLENMVNSGLNSVANMPGNLVSAATGLINGSSEQALNGLGRQITDTSNVMTGGAGGAAIDDLRLNQLSQDPNLSRLITNDRGSQLGTYTNNNYDTYGGAGTSTSYANIDDYLKNGDNSLTTNTVQGGRNLGTDKNNSNQAQVNATNMSRDALRQGLDSIINTTGVKNQAHLINDDANNEALNRAKRFKGLVG